MWYLFRFRTKADYDAYKENSNYMRPNVSTIEESKIVKFNLVGLGSDYIAANAAWKYNDGVSNTQWYLPAMGELGFLMPRFNAINTAITAAGGVAVLDDYYIWSSSENSSGYAYFLGPGNGYVRSNLKVYNYYVRPFAML